MEEHTYATLSKLLGEPIGMPPPGSEDRATIIKQFDKSFERRRRTSRSIRKSFPLSKQRDILLRTLKRSLLARKKMGTLDWQPPAKVLPFYQKQRFCSYAEQYGLPSEFYELCPRAQDIVMKMFSENKPGLHINFKETHFKRLISFHTALLSLLRKTDEELATLWGSQGEKLASPLSIYDTSLKPPSSVLCI